MDNTTVNTNITVSQLNDYINQGCIFLPVGGYRSSDGWHNTDAKYLSSIEATSNDAYMLAFSGNSINPAHSSSKSTTHAIARLVKNVSYGEETPFESSTKDVINWNR